MRRPLIWLGAFCLVAAGVAYAATAPRALPQEVIASLPAGDATRGETWFWAGGCASCHAEKGAEGPDRLGLGGGRVLKTAYGDFTVPNISTDPRDGIGDWSAGDFANAMLRGVSPEGEHYYPAFPYTSFTRMRVEDIADLWAFWQTLPAVAGVAPGHDLAFPYNIRRGLGLWQLVFLSDAPAVALDGADAETTRGQYLAEGPGHCGECHTPRNFAGALDTSRWLAGAPAAEGDGKVPDITPGPGGIGDWSASDIAYFFESGFLPDYDSVGGSMVEVQENLAMLEPSDREALAAYLKAVPEHASAE